MEQQKSENYYTHKDMEIDSQLQKLKRETNLGFGAFVLAFGVNVLIIYLKSTEAISEIAHQHLTEKLTGGLFLLAAGNVVRSEIKTYFQNKKISEDYEKELSFYSSLVGHSTRS